MKETAKSPPQEAVEDTFVSIRPAAVGDDSLESLIPVGEDIQERFEIHSVLGEGGMGKVLVGEDRRLCRVVAIKVMHDHMVKHRSVVRRFFVEAQVGAQLEHPNILPFYNLERTAEGAPAFSMRLIEGKDLSDYIERCIDAEQRGDTGRGRYSLKTRLDHFCRICDGIAYAHSRGVIHRDLKPANIMLGSFNQAYVMDWGLARVKDQSIDEMFFGDDEVPAVVVTASDPSKRTEMGQVVGTPVYMPPEQAAGRQDEVGEKSDQYSLGMILYELVTLRLPRSGNSVEETLGKAAIGDRAELKMNDGSDVPAGLAAIIDKATASRSQLRYDSVEALAADVRRFIRDEELEVMPDAPLRKLTRTLAHHPVVSMAILLLLLLSGAGAVIASLEQAVTSRERAVRQMEGLTELYGTIVAMNRASNDRLRRFEGRVEALASMTRELLLNPRTTEFAPLTPTELLTGRGPKDAKRRDRYGDQTVTFEAPIFLWPSGVEPSAIEASIRALGPLRQRLPALGQEVSSGLEEQTVGAARSTEEGPIFQYAYVGLPNGLLVNFPGNAPYPDDYDASKRPWFKGSVDARVPTWGPPYPDASSGLPLLPCNMAVRDPSGALLGVVGMDLSLSLIERRMENDHELLRGWRRSVVINRKGETLTSSEHAAPRITSGVHDNEPLQLPPFQVPAVLDRLAKGDRTGWEKVGDSVYAFDLLHSAGYYSVFEVAAEAYGL